MIDYGYPMTTESNALKDIIPPPNIINQILSIAGFRGSYIPSSILSPIAWRKANVKHTKDQFFVDIIEELTAIINKHGQFITLFSKGKISCFSNISGGKENLTFPGVPNIFLNIKPKYDPFYSSFHPCLQTSHQIPLLEQLSFVPPDGKFTLMTYGIELSDTFIPSLPFSIEAKSDKLAKLNEKNRKANLDTVRQAEIQASEEHKKQDASPIIANPFSRLRTNPKIFYDNMSSEFQKPDLPQNQNTNENIQTSKNNTKVDAIEMKETKNPEVYIPENTAHKTTKTFHNIDEIIAQSNFDLDLEI
ncbi:hypothetical protein PCK2_000633 [Pneumocystis canis]|nr:hypothetical protein PCK2_000633 [Pneumocystis canis]